MYGHRGYLGHVAQMPRTNFRSPYPRRLHTQKMALIGQVVSEEKMFEKCERMRDHGYTISSSTEPEAQVS